jgi:ParB family chromosome partitioning protein
MGTNAGGVTELQAFLNAHPRRSYRQGVGSIPIQAIRPNPQPTRSEPRPELLAELVASIKAGGLMQPLIVRPVAGFAHQFEVVAGERRLKAAQLAGLSSVPVIIRDLSDPEAVAVSLIENIQREELSAVDEARALSRLIQDFSLTHEEVAHAIGRSRASVSNLLRLLELPPEVTAMLDAGKISMGHARALLGVEVPEERVRLAQMIDERRWSVREAESQVRKTARMAAAAHGRAAPAPRLAAVSEIMRGSGLRAELHQRADGSGKIVIEFADGPARDAVLERLGTIER